MLGRGGARQPTLFLTNFLRRVVGSQAGRVQRWGPRERARTGPEVTVDPRHRSPRWFPHCLIQHKFTDEVGLKTSGFGESAMRAYEEARPFLLPSFLRAMGKCCQSRNSRSGLTGWIRIQAENRNSQPPPWPGQRNVRTPLPTVSPCHL